MNVIKIGLGKPHLVPSDLIASFTAGRGYTAKDIGVGDLVLLLFNRRTLMEIVKITGAELSKLWMYGDSRPLYNAQIEGRKISLFGPTIGAPATIMHMEELIACGAKAFISCGGAGSIREDLEAGELVVVTEAVREEGTSFHYLSPDVSVRSSLKLSEVIVAACKKNGVNPHLGATWTIDAPYMETDDKIAAYSTRGVLTVEMEASAMFALGAFRGIEVGTLLIITDQMTKAWTSENMRIWGAKSDETMRKVPNILMDAVKMFPKPMVPSSENLQNDIKHLELSR